MRTLPLLTLLILLALPACQTSPDLQQELTGQWHVRISLPEDKQADLDRDMKKAKKDLEDAGIDLADAKQNIRTELQEAGKEIRQSLEDEGIHINTSTDGQSSELADGLTKMVEGLGQMVEGLDTMGVGLGTAITRAITENLELRVDLKADGTVGMTSTSDKVDLDIDHQDTRWKVEEGKFVLYGDEEPEIMDIVPTEDGYDLVGKEMIFHLRKAEQ